MVRKIIGPAKGTRDFYPQDQAWQNWLYNKARLASESFGYQEYEGPILEPFSLYAAKSSEEIVKKQSFIISPRGKLKQEKIVLRPELTPTLARMVAAREYQLVFPLRWWSWGRFFRYETPQKGRGREFFQWNVDLLGDDTPNADAEVIAVGIKFLSSLGLGPDKVVIKINDRKYLDEKFNIIGIPKNKKLAIFRVVDKKNKVSEADFKEMLTDEGLTRLQIKDLLLALEDYDYGGESDWLTELFSALTDLGVKDWVEFDPTIVRGFDYYTDTVFEARARKVSSRALFGGGRYQNLVADVGGTKKIGGVGLAAGDMMIYQVLFDLACLPRLPFLPADFLVTVFSEELFRSSVVLANLLRENSINTELYLDYRATISKQLTYANKKGVRFALILGPDEKAAGEVTIKDLISGRQEKFKQKSLVKKLKKRFFGKLRED
jgi:histidyl-tRNA synthetase